MLKKVSNILVALILLISFTGFTVDLHYCKDSLYDIGIFSEAMSCCGEDAGQPHAMHCEKGDAELPGKCDSENHDPKHCENRSVKIERPDDFLISSSVLSFNQEPVSIIQSNIFSPLNISFSSDERIPVKFLYRKISPPETAKVLSLLQSYLI